MLVHVHVANSACHACVLHGDSWGQLLVSEPRSSSSSWGSCMMALHAHPSPHWRAHLPHMLHGAARLS